MEHSHRRTPAWLGLTLAAVAVALVAAAPAAEASGVEFAIVHSPNPALAQGSYLDGVSCSASTACAAVGQYVDADGADRALAEIWNGDGWGTTVVHLPTGAVSSELYKVSCASATSCLAVGRYDGADSVDHPLAEHWDGSSWTDAAAVANGPAASSLNSVSCTTAAVCMAVGYGTNGPSGDVLTERWNGSTWTLIAAAAPPGPFPVLQAVSCVATASCTAVGEYAGTSGESTLGERWNGKVWKLSTTRNRLGESNYLYGVTCVAPTSCVAVGSHDSSPGFAKPLIETFTAPRWNVAHYPVPAEATYSDLIGIACASSSSCIAVGSQAGPDSDGKAFAENWTGTSWSLDKVAHPPKATGTYLNGAYCPAAGSCTFAGGYSTNTSVDRTLIEVATPAG